MNFYQFFITKYTALNNQVKCFSFFFTLMTFYSIFLWMLPKNNWVLIPALFFAGWISWTFFEYILHRFWMHDKDSVDDSPMAQRHHHHHTHPTEIKVTAVQRLVLILIVSALVIFSLWFMIYFLIVAGFVFGFAGYTLMHWVLHQRWSAKIFPRLNRHHIYHHCKFPNSCYGVSVCWWDLLFKTTPPGDPVLVQRIIDFYFGDVPKKKQAIGNRQYATQVAVPNKSEVV